MNVPLDHWKGKTIDDISVAWGTPDRLQTLSDGRKVITYEERNLQDSRSYCRVWFTASAQNTIAEHRVDGTPGACRRLLRDKP